MTPEELDEARAKEAERRWNNNDPTISDIATGAARLARENWTPPEPVDPDLLAFREWLVEQWPELQEEATSGETDSIIPARAYLAGARMAREQEQERARKLAEFVEDQSRRLDGVGARAHDILAKYRGEA